MNTAGTHKEINIYDLTTTTSALQILPSPSTILKGHTDWVTSLQVVSSSSTSTSTQPNSGARWMLSAGRDDLIHFWSMVDEFPLRTLCIGIFYF